MSILGNTYGRPNAGVIAGEMSAAEEAPVVAPANIRPPRVVHELLGSDVRLFIRSSLKLRSHKTFRVKETNKSWGWN